MSAGGPSFRGAVVLAVVLSVLVGLVVGGAILYRLRQPPPAAPERPAATSPPPTTASAAAQLWSLPAEKRDAVLRSIVASSGLPCPKVTRSFLNGTAKTDGPFAKAGTSFSSVACSNGQSYLVQVDPQGHSTSVLTCAAAPECFKRF